MESGALGYMARCLVLATLPHSNPYTNVFERKNGDFKIRLTDVLGFGLPFGSYPRLLLAWLTSRAVLTKSREINLGVSLSSFMKDLGFQVTGGNKGTIKTLKDQSVRLFGSAITCSCDVSSYTNADVITITDEFNVWWQPINIVDNRNYESRIILTEKFFNEITSNPVPIDLRALKALKNSPMALDVYIWLTYRYSYLYQKTVIPWKQIQWQFGAGYQFTSQGRNDFQKSFKRQLKNVLQVYPEARIEMIKGRLILKPSPTHIPKSRENRKCG